jgi:protein-S-isoprenylcysteine O-methyltransferase Ste14
MTHLVFLAVVGSAFAVVASLILSIVRPRRSVWPLPQRDEPAWRVRRSVSRAAGMLVVLAGLGALGLALLDRGSLELPAFLAAPFAEEPWLRRHLGPPYDDFLRSVPRFLGLPRKAS